MTSLLCVNFMHKTDQLAITYLKALHLHKSAQFVGLNFDVTSYISLLWGANTQERDVTAGSEKK